MKLPAVVFSVSVGAVLAFAARPPQEPQPRPQPSPPSPSPPAPAPPALGEGDGDAVLEALRQVRRELLAGGRREVEGVVARVRELGRHELTAAQRESWVQVARLVALRLGDRPWLEALREHENKTRTELGYVLMLARSQLEHADLDAASTTLDRAGDIDGANERDKRRAYALRARIAELRGDAANERRAIEDIVDHLYLWPMKRCRECHSSTKTPELVTGLPLRESWIGDRYVRLLQQNGDAEAVRARAVATLAEDPQDDDARIHLAFALLALGRSADADELLRALPWVVFPDRELPKPRQFSTYP
ncbi:MAG: tetratricopeptide repeat protein [Planctomycetes bacterium]|nr:tetratricopeptide repeat protein [Planctomycetota bacterium]